MCVCLSASWQDTSTTRSHASYSIQKLECKILIWKSKCGVYVRVNTRLSYSVFVCILRYGTAWHLAFSPDSNGDCVCFVCLKNIMYLLLIIVRFSSCFIAGTKPSQGNDGKLNDLHWRQTVVKGFKARIKHTHSKCACGCACLVEIQRYRWLPLAYSNNYFSTAVYCLHGVGKTKLK